MCVIWGLCTNFLLPTSPAQVFCTMDVFSITCKWTVKWKLHAFIKLGPLKKLNFGIKTQRALRGLGNLQTPGPQGNSLIQKSNSIFSAIKKHEIVIYVLLRGPWMQHTRRGWCHVSTSCCLSTKCKQMQSDTLSKRNGQRLIFLLK